MMRIRQIRRGPPYCVARTTRRVCTGPMRAMEQTLCHNHHDYHVVVVVVVPPAPTARNPRGSLLPRRLTLRRRAPWGPRAGRMDPLTITHTDRPTAPQIEVVGNVESQSALGFDISADFGSSRLKCRIPMRIGIRHFPRLGRSTPKDGRWAGAALFANR